MRLLRKSIGAALAVTLSSVAGQASAADVQALDAKVHKWTADMNAGNMKAFYAACAPHVAVVDGFPPYAWDSCQAWMRDYDANNHRVKAPRGMLTIGEPLWTDVNGDKALLTYAAVFTDVQDGKAMTYKGLWAVSFTHTKRGWLITGSGSSWRAD